MFASTPRAPLLLYLSLLPFDFIIPLPVVAEKKLSRQRDPFSFLSFSTSIKLACPHKNKITLIKSTNTQRKRKRMRERKTEPLTERDKERIMNVVSPFLSCGSFFAILVFLVLFSLPSSALRAQSSFSLTSSSSSTSTSSSLDEGELPVENDDYIATTRRRRRRKNYYSVLQNAQKSDVRLHPYPHVVVENCLPEELYLELERDYPSYKDILKVAKPGRSSIAPNTRVDLRASMVLSSSQSKKSKKNSNNNRLVSKSWEEFVKYHSSREFYEEVIDLFGEEVFRKYHGQSMEEKYGTKLREMETEVRLMSRKKNPAPVTLDAQIGVNTPVVKGQSRVRGLHVDNPHELYAGLLYFRDENDPATGGNLEIYECLNAAGKCEEYSEAERLKHKKRVGWDVQFKNLGDFKLVGEVPYEKNMFAMFINSNSSYHAVTPRSASAYPRRLINIAANEYYKKDN